MKTQNPSNERLEIERQSTGLSGHELDAAVAVKIMGYVINGSHWPGPGFWLTDRPYGQFGHGSRGDGPRTIGRLHDSKNKGGDPSDLWSPTTQIAVAMQVVEKMRDDGWSFACTLYEGKLPYASFCKRTAASSRNAEAPTLPEAICRAALAAIGELPAPPQTQEEG